MVSVSIFQYNKLYFVRCIETLEGSYPSSFEEFTESRKRPFIEAHNLQKVYRVYNRSTVDAEKKEALAKIDAVLQEENAKLPGPVERWYEVDFEKEILTQIEKPKLELKEIGSYDGNYTEKEIFEHVKKLRDGDNSPYYAVFECKECKKISYSRIVVRDTGEYVKCEHCKEPKGLSQGEATLKKKFDSSNEMRNKANAMALNDLLKSSKQAENEKSKAEDEESKKVNAYMPFVYDSKEYHVEKNDCLLLHKKLYWEFAWDAIFDVIKNENVDKIQFKNGYKVYLKSVQQKKLFDDFVDVESIEGIINDFYEPIRPVENVFYWYISKYWMECKTTTSSNCLLVWKVNCGEKEIVWFSNQEEFATKLLNSDSELAGKMVEIYERVVALSLDGDFFGKYTSGNIALSEMIFDTCKEFVYFKDDKTIVPFGKDFIDTLHVYDDKIEDRIAFLCYIQLESEFWEKIKGSFNEYDLFESNDPYDIACYYQFAICGYKRFRYKDISFENSVDGLLELTKIVADAYLQKGEDSKKKYIQLAEVLKNDKLVEKFEGIRQGKFGELTFDGIIDKIKNENTKTPSIGFYLDCVDTSTKNVENIEFMYGGSRDTLAGHIKGLLKRQPKDLANAVRDFYNDKDVGQVVERVINNIIKKGYDDFITQQKKGFEEMLEQIKKLEQIK